VSPEAVAAWARLLAALEADVERARRGLPLEAWEPPLRMPPLPASFEDRARALLAAHAELEASVDAARAELARTLARGRRLARADSARPVYLDSLD
jgi:hypothetical protein